MKQIVIKLSQTVSNIKEAEQARETLRRQDALLWAAIKRERLKSISPIVQSLNCRLTKGEVLYFEFCEGNHRGICYSGDGMHFGLRKDSRLVYGCSDDFEKYTAIDRVYKLNLNGKSELVYDSNVN